MVTEGHLAVTKHKKIGVCAFCEKPRTLCDSHIQPRWLYRARGSDLKLIMKNYPFPIKAPKGPYERLLCLECEGLMGKYDDYSAVFFKESKHWFRDERTNWKVTYTYDYPKLKLFMLSMLWRAAKAQLEFFSLIQLSDETMNDLRAMIKSGDPGNEHDYSVMVSMRERRNGLEKLGWNPAITVRQDNLKWSRFDLNEFGCDIKVSREESTMFEPVLLRPTPPLLIVTGPTLTERLDQMKNHELQRKALEEQFRQTHKKTT